MLEETKPTPGYDKQYAIARDNPQAETFKFLSGSG
jgi:hypothetical protein